MFYEVFWITDLDFNKANNKTYKINLTKAKKRERNTFKAKFLNAHKSLVGHHTLSRVLCSPTSYWTHDAQQEIQLHSISHLTLSVIQKEKMKATWRRKDLAISILEIEDHHASREKSDQWSSINVEKEKSRIRKLNQVWCCATVKHIHLAFRRVYILEYLQLWIKVIFL